MEDISATSLPRQLAGDLLRIGAVSLAPDAPFTWSSGRKAPIYCDNRLTLAFPSVREHIAEGFMQCLHDNTLTPEVVAGTATAGIPHAAWLADQLGAPMAYVRSRAKEHGKGRQIEGASVEGQSVVLVEDLISTGGSAMEAVEALQQAGAQVEAVLAIFTYGLPAAEHQFEPSSLPLYTLTTFDALLEVAVEEGRLASRDLKTLRQWRDDPAGWSEQAAARAQAEE